MSRRYFILAKGNSSAYGNKVGEEKKVSPPAAATVSWLGFVRDFLAIGRIASQL